MNKLEITETYNDHLTEDQMRQLEDGLRILARMIAKAVLREGSLLEISQHRECRDLGARTHQVTSVGESDEPLTLSVEAAARILGLSRASAYEAVRTGQIPSLRFGKRIVIPRAALNRMLSQAGNCGSDDK
jgi:excisionase family DNA binding protein